MLSTTRTRAAIEGIITIVIVMAACLGLGQLINMLNVSPEVTVLLGFMGGFPLGYVGASIWIMRNF